eukprot:jgi/Undpi1/9537/HiC_scaffold_27.g11993.m1
MGGEEPGRGKIKQGREGREEGGGAGREREDTPDSSTMKIVRPRDQALRYRGGGGRSERGEERREGRCEGGGEREREEVRERKGEGGGEAGGGVGRKTHE